MVVRHRFLQTPGRGGEPDWRWLPASTSKASTKASTKAIANVIAKAFAKAFAT